MNKIIIFVLLTTNIIALTLLLVNVSTTTKNSNAIAQASPLPSSKNVMLPADAIKTSECIPFEGEHYVRAADVPLGPLYTVFNKKVMSIEYMFTPDQIPGEKEAKLSPAEAEAVIKKNNLKLSDLVHVHNFEFSLFNHNYHSLEMNWSSPHSGLISPHYDIHLYLVDKAERDAICPDARLEDVYSQEVLDNMKKYKIPFPAPIQ